MNCGISREVPPSVLPKLNADAERIYEENSIIGH